MSGPTWRYSDAALRAQRALLTRQLRDLAATARNKRRQDGRRKTIPPGNFRVAVALTKMNNGDAVPGMQFLRAVGKLNDSNSSQTQEALQQLAAEGGSAAPLPLLPGHTPWAGKTAWRVHNERQLHQWIERQNLTKGLAPSLRTTWRAWARLRSRELTASDQSPVRCTSQRVAYKWLTRYRQRWRLRRGRLPPRERLPDDTAQQKAPASAFGGI